jgi:hypothetical protein
MPPLSVNYSFQEVHVDIARRIARIAKEQVCESRVIVLVNGLMLYLATVQGVGTLIHLSALSANKYSASKFLRTKVSTVCDYRVRPPCS